MKFREFMFLEVLDIAKEPTDHIKWTRFNTAHASPNSRAYRFEDQDGNNYEVQLHHAPDKFFDIPVNCYEISFFCNNSSDLTGNQLAPTVYKQVLLAVKKLIEEKHPQMLTFYGAEESQDIMYEVFAKKFLADSPGKQPHQVFYRISSESFISKELLMGLPPQKQAELNQMINRETQERDEYINSLRQDKSQNRERAIKLAQVMPRLIGKFVQTAESPQEMFLVLGPKRGSPYKASVIAVHKMTGACYIDDVILDYDTRIINPSTQRGLLSFLNRLFDRQIPGKNPIRTTVLETLPQQHIRELQQLWTQTRDV